MTSGVQIFKDIKKILVIKFRHIGDVLLTVPAIRALKETFPGVSISALVNSGTEEVLTGNTVVDEVIVFDRALKSLPAVSRYVKEIKFIRGIRLRRFDMTVDLTGGDRAAVVSFISGARYRLAWNPGKKGFLSKRFLYTHLADIDKQKHMVLQNLDVVKNFGITTEDTDVDFFIPGEARLLINKILKENNIKSGDTIVHVHPTSRWLFKCWKDEYMADVIEWLIEQGIRVIMTSAPDGKEMEKAKKILSLTSPRTKNYASEVINLCGKTTIKELAAISEISDLFIGVDSAPMHIAAAVGTPVIALFGPTGREWIPYGQGNIVISKDMPCKPCKKGMCEGILLRECMAAIKPDDVKEAVCKILNLGSSVSSSFRT
ncbi:MAG: putative lipopolysaccharide heptosyltransferase III [Nitrospirota bacterium]